MKIVCLLVSIVFTAESCSQAPKIQITKEYLVNRYWGNGFSNYFIIEKMKLKQDSSLDIFRTDFNATANSVNVVEKLESDTSFAYHYVSRDNTRILDDIIYFGKSNKGEWHAANLRLKTLGQKVEILGNLENNTWYKFSKLRDRPFFVYVYVDSIGMTHRFDYDLSNY